MVSLQSIMAGGVQFQGATALSSALGARLKLAWPNFSAVRSTLTLSCSIVCIVESAKPFPTFPRMSLIPCRFSCEQFDKWDVTAAVFETCLFQCFSPAQWQAAGGIPSKQLNSNTIRIQHRRLQTSGASTTVLVPPNIQHHGVLEAHLHQCRRAGHASAVSLCLVQ
jgi:hypothetical protein